MSDFLIVVLDDLKPGLVLLPDNQDTVVWNGRELKDTGIRTLVGFFDWLRTDDELVIGVRLTIFDDELDYLVPEFARPAYVHQPDSVIVEIFFTEERQFNPELSNDQDFLDNWIYLSTDGLCAISFDARYAIESLRTNKEFVLATGVLQGEKQ